MLISTIQIATRRAGLAMHGSSAIESGVQPVVDALNAVPGVKALWSCQGHAFWRPRNPFVTFLASTEQAFLFHQALEYEYATRTLHYCWTMLGGFRDDGAMQYSILPNDFRLMEGQRHWIAPIWRLSVDRELRVLASVILKAASNEGRP